MLLACIVALSWTAVAVGRQAAQVSRAPSMRFVMDTTQVCDSRSLAQQTWCPRPQAGVIGGAFKEVDVRAGDTIEFELHADVETRAPNPLFLYPFVAGPETPSSLEAS